MTIDRKNTKISAISDFYTDCREVLFDCFSPWIHRTFAQIDHVDLNHRTWSNYTQTMVLWLKSYPRQFSSPFRRRTPESEAFHTKHEVPKVETETRNQTYHHETRLMQTVTETEVELLLPYRVLIESEINRYSFKSQKSWSFGFAPTWKLCFGKTASAPGK